MRTEFWRGKRVLVTGVCGTVGAELLRQLASCPDLAITGIDNAESELFFLSESYRHDERIQFYLGDIRDGEKLLRQTHGIDVILHAAALKHVILCEKSPEDAVQTNILGTQNVIRAALANQVGRVIFTSSDKAVNPTNVMGTSKLMGERLITAANIVPGASGIHFSSIRFGNVLGSRGSVVPLFARQIAQGGPVTITHPEMTRFVMSLREAVGLVMDAASFARGGEVFVTKMPVIRIQDLARVMVAHLAPRFGQDPEKIEIRVIGSKPGEKLYEELLNEEEIRRTVELEHYFVIKPAFSSIYRETATWGEQEGQPVPRPYVSSTETPLSPEELHHYLLTNSILEA